MRKYKSLLLIAFVVFSISFTSCNIGKVKLLVECNSNVIPTMQLKPDNANTEPIETPTVKLKLGNANTEPTKTELAKSFKSLMDEQEKLVFAASDDRITIRFKGETPEKIELYEHHLFNDGTDMYLHPDTVEVTKSGDLYSFSLGYSSYSLAESDPGRDQYRGLLLVCTQNENITQYVFVVETTLVPSTLPN